MRDLTEKEMPVCEVKKNAPTGWPEINSAGVGKNFIEQTGSLFFGLVFILGLAASAHAERLAEEKKVGDWILYEDRSADENPLPPPKGIADTARTSDLKGRNVDLLAQCQKYDVNYLINEDTEFNSALQPNPVAENGATQEVTQAIYVKTDKDEEFQKTLSFNVYQGRFFNMTTGALLAAGVVAICPTPDGKNPACLTFSLKGITAALKAICPKR
jgi:hypothetical protein